MLTKTKAAIVTTLFLSLGAQADTILNVATAGDQNMVDYVKTWLGPKFEAAHPGVKVRVIGTGPGDAGSNKISEKLTAQQESGAQQWDIDVAVVHQKAGGEQVAKGLLQKYLQDIQTGGMVSSPSATQALGVNVDGYVMPMFLSQTAIAWNSDLVTTPPASYDELVAADLVTPLEALSWLGWKGIVITFVWKQLAFATLLICGAMAALESSQILAARNLGASRPRILFDIMLPQVLPTIGVALVLSTVTMMSVLSVPLMIGVGTPTMLTVDMAFRVNSYGDYAVANALGVVSLAICGVLSWFYLRHSLQQKGGES